MTFLKEPMIILRRGQSNIEVIDIKFQKVEDFSLSQNIGLVYR